MKCCSMVYYILTKLYFGKRLNCTAINRIKRSATLPMLGQAYNVPEYTCTLSATTVVICLS